MRTMTGLRPASLMTSLTAFGFLLVLAVPLSAQKPGEETEHALQQMAEAFVQKVGEHPAFSLELVVDGEGRWHVCFDGAGGADVAAGPADAPVFRFSTDVSTFRRIATGDLVGMTAMGQATPDDPTPLDMEPGPGAEEFDDVRALFLQVAMHFFNPTLPGRVALGSDHARVVHGASVVGLFYREGLRSGWYRVDDGQRLNAPGDTNPFPQTFVVVAGSGRAKIGEEMVPVQAGNAYFIPPNSDHVVWPDEGGFVELVWIAWGEGA